MERHGLVVGADGLNNGSMTLRSHYDGFMGDAVAVAIQKRCFCHDEASGVLGE
jgi:hypothetical protein